MKPIKMPMDRQRKQPTNKQTPNNEFEKLLTEKLQESYFKGVTFGSHMQCSTILEIFKAKLEEIPSQKLTKELLITLLEDIFKFCDNGCSNNLDLKQFSQQK